MISMSRKCSLYLSPLVSQPEVYFSIDTAPKISPNFPLVQLYINTLPPMSVVSNKHAVHLGNWNPTQTYPFQHLCMSLHVCSFSIPLLPQWGKSLQLYRAQHLLKLKELSVFVYDIWFYPLIPNMHRNTCVHIQHTHTLISHYYQKRT